MNSEKLHLKWDDYEANIRSVFQELKEDTDHVDVTLSCHDGQIHAHKVILSASSSIFRDLLRRNNLLQHNHPIIYLRGVHISDLRLVLDFVYRGEVSVAPENIDSFLDVGKDLRIKGLTEADISGDGGSHTKQSTVESSQRSRNPVSGRHDPVGTTASEHAGGVDVQDQEKMETATANGFTKEQMQTEPGQLLKNDQVLASTMEEEDDAAMKNSTHLQVFDQHILTAEDGSFSCGICYRSLKCSRSSYNARRHVEAKHFPNTFAYQCTQCPRVMGSKSAWDNHRRNHPKNKNLSYVLTRKLGIQKNIGQSEDDDEQEYNGSLYEDGKVGKEGEEQVNNNSSNDDSKEANKHENKNTHDEEESPPKSNLFVKLSW